VDDAIRTKLLETEAGRPVLEALTVLLADDAYLLRVDANERSVVHRFALHLQAQLPKLHVDCEYNRDRVDPKRIEHFSLNADSEDTEGKTISPDVIAHIRGSEENYLVIEVKKTTNTVSRKVDFAKLRGYKRDLKYRFALFIELAAGEGKADVSRVEWID
jgi:hypothetical protein